MYRRYRICLILLCLLLTDRAGAAPVVTVRLEGLDGVLEQNVLSYLTIEQEKESSDLNERRIRRYHARADREIRAALQPFGYYHPQIESALSQQDGKWTATYRVDPGPPVLIASVDIDIKGPGEHDPALKTARDSVSLKPGKRLIHADYESAKSRLLTAAQDSGYREAAYRVSEVRVYQEDNRAEVILLLETGAIFRFGTVHFSGSDLSEKLLQSYVPFRTGDTWSRRQLLKLQRILVDSNYFSAVNIIPLPVPEGSTEVPLEVSLIPRKNQKYSFGLGYSTDTGPQLSFDWVYRKLNRQGHHLGVESSASKVEQNISGSYFIPLSRPQTDVLEITTLLRHEDTEDIRSRIKELRVSHNTERNKWRQVLSLGYKKEDYDVGGSGGISDLLIPRLTWTLVDADNRLVARKGLRFELETSAADKKLLSDTSFLQGIVRAKLIHPLGRDWRLVTRAETSATAISSVDELPASNRFFAGGDNSVRGYAYKSLGPTDDSGEVIGGKYLMVGSVEFDYRFLDKWYGAVFWDAGNAFNDWPMDARNGAGVGIRWASPLGMVRVDVASALDEAGDPWRLHITFGPDF